MTTIKTFVFNAFQENTYVLCDESNNCVIIDPGMNSAAENEDLLAFINRNRLKPQAILNTHCHVDHVLGCKFLKEEFKIPFYIHKNEEEYLKRASEFGAVFGLDAETPPDPDNYLDASEEFILGNIKLKLLFVPGHSEGSIAFYSADAGFVITGDALFAGSIGRTDLPGGDYSTLIDSIKEQLLTLPSETQVYPGHGPSSTIQQEKSTNPFLN